MIHCPVLSLPVEVCSASGNHPLCRKCPGQENEPIDILPAKERRRKKKCHKCRKVFSPTNNSQRFCKECRKWNDNKKTRLRMSRFREKAKTRSVVTIEASASMQNHLRKNSDFGGGCRVMRVDPKSLVWGQI